MFLLRGQSESDQTGRGSEPLSSVIPNLVVAVNQWPEIFLADKIITTTLSSL